MKFINLTPHPVVLSNGALRITFEKDPRTSIARVELMSEERSIQCEVAPGMKLDIPVTTVTQASVYGLPDPEPGVMYIVSTMVANHVKRSDVIAPITDSTCERDGNGRVLSVKGFQTFTEHVPTQKFLQVSTSGNAIASAAPTRYGSVRS